MFEWYCPPKAFGGEFAYRWYAKENVREIEKKNPLWNLGFSDSKRVSPPKKDGGMNQTLKEERPTYYWAMSRSHIAFICDSCVHASRCKQTNKRMILKWKNDLDLFSPIYVDWLLRHHTWEWCSPCIYIIHGTFLVMHNRPELYITATTSQSLLFVIIYVSLCAVHTNRRRIRKAKTV